MLRLEKLSKVYGTKKGEVRALNQVDLEIQEGEFVVVRGPSGSGKTTALLVMGGMLQPTEGRALAWGEDLYALASGARARFRAKHVGFVFQNYYLVPYLNTLENVLLSKGDGPALPGRSEAEALLKRLNLSARLHHKPSQLSTGERQRAALARALLNSPKVILADEPTGNLDPDNAKEVLDHLKAFHEQGGTVVVVTHGTTADPLANRIIQLKEGCVLEA